MKDMKKKWIFVIIGITLLFPACSEDNDGPDPHVDGKDKEILFVFPGLARGGAVPYNTRAIANPAEEELVALDIYVFNGTDDNAKLEGIYHSGKVDDADNEFILGGVGEDKTARISVPEGNTKGFFFVGNGRSIISLNESVEGETLLGNFRDLLVDKLSTDTHIAPPLLMSYYHPVADMSSVSSAIEITLSRRMARFDIRNVARDSNFDIEQILIFNTRSATRIFDTASAPYDAELISMSAIDFTASAGANEGEVGSVFYIYPTLNDADADEPSETHLSLVGKAHNTGAVQIYPVKFEIPDTDDPSIITHLQIKPNHRYILSVESQGMAELVATLKVDDWIAGEEIPTDVGVGTIKVYDENGQVIPKNTLTIDAAGGTIDLKVEAISKWYVDIDDGDTWVTSDDDPDNDEVGDAFTLTIDANASGAARTAIIYVRNKVDKYVLQPVIIQQGG